MNGYTNQDILQIAMKQSALDLNCHQADFLESANIVVKSELGSLAKKYYKEPIACNLVSYGNNIVASVKDEYRSIVEEYMESIRFTIVLKRRICIGWIAG